MASGDLLGFVGVGRMGGPMCGRLLDAGHRVCVFDTNPAAIAALTERGAEGASSPRDVAHRAATVFVSLPMPAIVETVVLGADDGLAGGTAVRTIVDLSTTGPATSTRIAAGLAGRPVAWVDAPVSGGVTGATKGTLAVMVSCPAAARARAEALLATFGRVFYVGEKPGLAQTAKLANNLLGAAAIAITAEACALGVKAGLDARVLLDIFNSGSGLNTASRDKFPQAVLTRTFDYGFATGLSHKDVRLCLEEADALGVPMVVGAAVRQMLGITSARFGPDSDFTSIARVVEEWAGVEIKG
jgi:3-hydroxyisobutyrate dehydrogenase-like beta-hydroxyacid dehydrogenase